MKKLYLALIVGMFLIGFASATDYPHKQNTELNFSVTSNFATSCELTTINTPNGVLTIEQTDTNTGTFNFNVLAGNYSTLGTYCHNIVCTDGTDTTSGQECREVTPSGSLITQGNSLVLFGSLLVMVVLSLVFLFIANNSENIVAKIAFYSFAGVGLLMAVLYTVVTIQQSLFGFDSIVGGIETFYFVLKILTSLLVVALIIVVAMVMLKAWKIKRGYVDE